MKKNEPKKILRGKNITPEIMKEIFEILDGWKGKITWELLIYAIAKRTFQEYTRQTLHGHEEIRSAFASKKGKAPLAIDGRKKIYKPEEAFESQRNKKLKEENIRLQAHVDFLIEKFNRWSYNAYIKGVTEKQLEQPLPKQ
jgi:hypothetical protein